MIDWIKINENIQFQEEKPYLFINKEKEIFQGICFFEEGNFNSKFDLVVIEIVTLKLFKELKDFTHYSQINLPK